MRVYFFVVLTSRNVQKAFVFTDKTSLHSDALWRKLVIRVLENYYYNMTIIRIITVIVS